MIKIEDGCTDLLRITKNIFYPRYLRKNIIKY